MSVTHARTNEAWVRDLAGGPDVSAATQAEALGELRQLLRRGALFTLGRMRAALADLSAAEVEQMAEDCAQEAVMAVLRRLPDFRSESKFTTWAYKFAVNIALTAGRREQWKAVSLDELLEDDAAPAWPQAQSNEAGPEQAALQAEAWRVIRAVIESDLSPKQRQALRALVFEQVPLDEVVRHFGSNRNAVYKLVHDARRRLKEQLEARGYRMADVLEVFGSTG
jgi:RNA polymerase sigma-70 factor (ECF subfamily)